MHIFIAHFQHFMTKGSPDAAPEYELFAVIVHLDVMNIASFGHYVAYMKASDGQWYICDDSKISQVPVATVMALNPYMVKGRMCCVGDIWFIYSLIYISPQLFYARKNPRFLDVPLGIKQSYSWLRNTQHMK